MNTLAEEIMLGISVIFGFMTFILVVPFQLVSNTDELCDPPIFSHIWPWALIISIIAGLTYFMLRADYE